MPDSAAKIELGPIELEVITGSIRSTELERAVRNCLRVEFENAGYTGVHKLWTYHLIIYSVVIP